MPRCQHCKRWKFPRQLKDNLCANCIKKIKDEEARLEQERLQNEAARLKEEQIKIDEDDRRRICLNAQISAAEEKKSSSGKVTHKIEFER